MTVQAQEADRTTSRPGDREPGAEAHDLLLKFLGEHDSPCPICGYNLKGLDRPVCPECRHDLVLAVGVRRLAIGWLLTALAPGCFSGMAASALAIPTTGAWIEDGRLFPPFAGAVLFGWCSGLLALLLAVKRNRFFALPRRRQRGLAAAIWLAHFGALGVFIYMLAPYIN